MYKLLFLFLGVTLISCNNNETANNIINEKYSREQLLVTTLYYKIKNDKHVQEVREIKDSASVFREQIKLISDNLKQESGFLGLTAIAITKSEGITKICDKGFCAWNFSETEYYQPDKNIRIAFGDLAVDTPATLSSRVVSSANPQPLFIKVTINLEDKQDIRAASGTYMNELVLFFDSNAIELADYAPQDHDGKIRTLSSPATKGYYQIQKETDSLYFIDL
ncbi:hypothetical protein [Flavobacterium beibuense]|uniref:Lipoprotein n=1 Tax=Flavobacterium beibuense TaxID=657326 RepID=A0A444WF28_9FLAO|nr:hypothetical protein [Flavobacterium beibuense]RYJ44461.1 hypothetical protein NU09_1071 [Flavobacterium beibuense]